MNLLVFHTGINLASQHDYPSYPVLSIDGTRNTTDIEKQSAILINIQNRLPKGETKYYLCSISLCHSECGDTV